MKKPFQLVLLLTSLLIFEKAFSQDKYGESPDLCKEKLSEFFEYAKTKDYQYAYEPWLWTFENCPKASKNIYKYGLKIIEDRYEKATGDQKSVEAQLIDKIYEQRIQYFPDNLGKVYSDWALWLEKRKASEEEIFKRLEQAFKTDPAQMSIKNIFKYFQVVTDKNKDTNLQFVFDTYDDALDAVNKKIDYHSKESDKLNKLVQEGTTLSKKQETAYKNHGINLRGLGQVETGFDQIIGEIASCDKLIPLYSKNLDKHKNDGKWLRRAASRLNTKECTEDPIYPKLVEAFVSAEPSPEAFAFISKIYEDRGEKQKANEYRKKAVESETDPYKKAKYLYNIGYSYINTSPSKAVSFARQALKIRPSFGKAYLLIAQAYAKSANNCGNDEFSKRIVYQAAADKAVQAKKVDQSIASLANKYITSYTASAPKTKDYFLAGYKPGDSYTIKCWVNETVVIP